MLSENICLYLFDKHNFNHVNQLVAAAGMPGLEFGVPRLQLVDLNVKYRCEWY